MRQPSTSPRTRRAVLSALGTGLVGLAGCAGGGTGTDDTERYPTVERSLGESHDPRSGPTVTVRNPRLRTAVVIDQHTSPVGMTAGRQFVVVDVESADDADPGSSSRFRALTDGTPAEGGSASLRSDVHPAERGRPVGVPVAVDAVDSAGVAWVRGLPKSAVWALPEEVVGSLGTAARFEVEEASVSDETDPEVTLVVRNAGDRDGTFYANVSGSQVQDGNAIVGVEVPAGETVTHRERPGIRAPAGEETRVVVAWGTDRVAVVVRP
ncbi:hypothetical protein [Haloplanus salilacus]|uniref:hypothetical protein n=1 Tax=Haloplanus salilacus TaxID=2949994 RepID=UPI0030D1375A